MAEKKPPYLQVDIDGRRRVVLASQSVGAEPSHVMWGLMDLWEHVWRTKTDVVGEFLLGGCLGPNENLRQALVECGFLERVDGGWRIRGAKKRLFGAAIRGAMGGKKSAESGKSLRNLKQNSSPKQQAIASEAHRSSSEANTEAPFEAAAEANTEAPPKLLRTPAVSSQQLESKEEASLSADAQPAPASEPEPKPFLLQEQKVQPKPRKLSRQQEFYAAAQADRKAHMGDTYLPDNAWSAAQVNAQLRFVPETDPQMLAGAWDLFLSDQRKGELNPPYPMWAFVRDWPQYASRAQRERGAA